ncbi:MAG: arginine--tRNA ligase [Mycoplasmatales bacterium]
MIFTKLKQTIEQNILEIIRQEFEVDTDAELSFELEIPAECKNGHFATNAAMKLTKVLRKNPREIATTIVEKYVTAGTEIERIEIAGPGFINFYLNDDFFKSIVEEINATCSFQFESTDANRYLIEYVSANPTGDLHLGHARNAIYGDALAKVMKKSGIDVKTEYYINDAGNQINNLGYSVKYYYLENLGIASEFPEDGYRGVEIQAIGKELATNYGTSKVDEDVSFFNELSVKINLANIEKILTSLNVHFDSWFSEKTLLADNQLEHMLDELKKHDALFEEDGALWLKSTDYYDDKDRVLVKSDGSLTYLAPDIIYHLGKFERGHDILIDVWGGDHHGYVARMKSAIKALGYEAENFEVVLLQMISILENNQAVKMSKRAGTSVRIIDFLEEIDPDVLRYFFVAKNPDTQLDFDIAVAKKQSNDNPVYYIQYAHARICSLLETAVEQNIEFSAGKITAPLSELEQELVSQLGRYELTINSAATKRLPHILANYLYDIAALYHKYYNNERVFGEDKNETIKKIIIAKAIKTVIHDGLWTLGIEAKHKM